ncbi:hypothetical protein BC831DRAFT_445648 [Entophlyctis helioformis]|nr:hypothetical protein BC831DRAFT_445648 [Entophlyctis helioformis]
MLLFSHRVRLLVRVPVPLLVRLRRLAMWMPTSLMSQRLSMVMVLAMEAVAVAASVVAGRMPRRATRRKCTRTWLVRVPTTRHRWMEVREPCLARTGWMRSRSCFRA